MPQTMYTAAEMSSFGRYLLSEERTARIDAMWKEGDPISKEERRREVYQADWENWQIYEGKREEQAAREAYHNEQFEKRDQTL